MRAEGQGFGIECYDRMSEVSSKDNYEQWIKLFLRAVKESAEDASDIILELAKLHAKNMEIINGMGHIDWHPVVFLSGAESDYRYPKNI